MWRLPRYHPSLRTLSPELVQGRTWKCWSSKSPTLLLNALLRTYTSPLSLQQRLKQNEVRNHLVPPLPRLNEPPSPTPLRRLLLHHSFRDRNMPIHIRLQRLVDPRSPTRLLPKRPSGHPMLRGENLHPTRANGCLSEHEQTLCRRAIQPRQFLSGG